MNNSTHFNPARLAARTLGAPTAPGSDRTGVRSGRLTEVCHRGLPTERVPCWRPWVARAHIVQNMLDCLSGDRPDLVVAQPADQPRASTESSTADRCPPQVGADRGTAAQPCVRPSLHRCSRRLAGRDAWRAGVPGDVSARHLLAPTVRTRTCRFPLTPTRLARITRHTHQPWCHHPGWRFPIWLPARRWAKLRPQSRWTASRSASLGVRVALVRRSSRPIRCGLPTRCRRSPSCQNQPRYGSSQGNLAVDNMASGQPRAVRCAQVADAARSRELTCRSQSFAERPSALGT